MSAQKKNISTQNEIAVILFEKKIAQNFDRRIHNEKYIYI